MNGTPDLEKKKDMDSTFATELIRWVCMHKKHSITKVFRLNQGCSFR